MTALLSTALNVTAPLAPALAGRAAFAAFVRPAGRSRARPAEAAVMAGAATGRLRVDGVSVATYRWGEGSRPVLLVHGWSSRAAKLSGFVGPLREAGATVVSFDAPGSGASGGRAVNIRQLREIIGLLHEQHGPFEAVIAHSFGALGTFFALREGVVADRVVALGPIADFDYPLDRFAQGMRVSGAVRRAMRRHVETRLFPGRPGIWDRLAATHIPEEIRARILVVHDVDDDVAEVAQGRALAAAHHGRARLVETRGLGHRRILHDPEVIAAAARFAVAGEVADLPQPAGGVDVAAAAGAVGHR
ncbi:alpha/beta hydrolase [Streptomyces sp. NPDC089919]|uniref:alpha/beta hydrolase n=1 Tax=Streptomyces sp. NPDC089919 TaxID=3155188 RepID=UPI0034414027